MRKLVAAVLAVAGLAILASSLSLLLVPISVLYMGLPFWQSVMAFALSLVPGIASVALGAYLVRDRERIATWYVPEDDAAPVVSTESLLRVGLVLLGVYLVVQAIPALLGLLTSPLVNWLQVRIDTIYGNPGFADQVTWGWVTQNIPRAVSNLVSLTFGYLLLAKREQAVARILGGDPVIAGEAEATLAQCQSCGASYDPADYDGGVMEARCMNCKEPLDLPRT